MKTVLMMLISLSTTLSMNSNMESEEVMIVPKQAKEIIKKFEGLRLTAYKDSVGVSTVGFGHTKLTPPPCTDCMVITEQQANGMLENDLEHTLSMIQGHIKADLTDNQLSAVLSFAFNLGANAFIKSTLLKELNNGNIDKASNEFLKWNKAGGKILAGLTKRRVAERELFLTPDLDGDVLNVASK